MKAQKVKGNKCPKLEAIMIGSLELFLSRINALT